MVKWPTCKSHFRCISHDDGAVSRWIVPGQFKFTTDLIFVPHMWFVPAQRGNNFISILVPGFLV
jgi:hypothetical protein